MKINAKLSAALVVCLLALFLAHLLVGVQAVGGNELGVKETWGGGVDPRPLPPRTYLFVPGFLTHVYTYDVSSQVFIMNNVSSTVDKVGKGRETDAYRVQSEEGQDMIISLSVRWHLDPAAVVDIHKSVRHSIEEKILRPTVMRVVKDAATSRHAIDAYSGPGLVSLQREIQDRLTAPGTDLRQRGVVVENFVIEGIELDKDYIGQIRARQVATQKKLTADEEQKAALAVAERAKAEAQADYNKRVVEAERDKAVGVLNAELQAQKEILAAQASKKQQILAAEAQKESVVLGATGEQQASELKARAILALGQSEAEATRLRLSAYAAPGADAFVRIEVSKNVGLAFSGVKGYLPADMKFNVLTESVLRSVDQLLGPLGAGTPSAAAAAAAGPGGRGAPALLNGTAGAAR